MPAPRKDYTAAISLYEAGSSLEDTALECGVSRQAMWKILKRRGVKFRPQLRYGAENHFYRGGAKRNANFVVIEAIRSGLLTVQPCESCGLPPKVEKGRQRIHAHHDDYNQLLKVRWLCKRCHDAWHASNKPIPRSLDWRPMLPKEIAHKGGKASWQKHREKLLKCLEAARKTKQEK